MTDTILPEAAAQADVGQTARPGQLPVVDDLLREWWDEVRVFYFATIHAHTVATPTLEAHPRRDGSPHVPPHPHEHDGVPDASCRAG